MKANGLVWLSTRTRNFDETVRFFGDTLGLHVAHEEPDFTVLLLPNGDKVEVFGPGREDHAHFDAGPVHEVDDGGSWSHFRGNDGNDYEITTPAKSGA